MFAKTVGLDDSFDFFLGKNPDLGAGSAGLRCRAGGAAGLLCRAAGASQPLAKKSMLLYVLYVLYTLYALQNVVYVLYKAYLVHVEMLCV